MRKLRILYVIDSLAVGGAEQIVVNLVNHLDGDRFETLVCCVTGRQYNVLQMDMQRLSAPIKMLNGRKRYEPGLPLQLARYIREQRIDVVHTHLGEADILGRIVGRLTGRPVISTLHNIPHQYDRLRWDRRWLQRLTARHLTTQLTTVSHRLREMYIQQWGIRPEHITSIYPTVAVGNYFGIAPGRVPAGPDDGPVVVTLGRLTRQKAHADLLTAAKQVLEQRPDARFVIAGQGYLMPTLKQMAADLGIAERVNFPGVRRDVPQVLAEADIFVLSSLWEGLPLSAVEAMAAARPAVVTDVGGCGELVEDGVHGYVVPPQQPQALADALLKLIANPQLREAMGRAARERVSADFAIATVTAQHERLYQSVWQAHQHGHSAAALVSSDAVPHEAKGRIQ